MTQRTARTSGSLRRIDTSVPHSSRVWDYWLGGTDNYRADREVGDEIVRLTPDLPVNARAERQFLGRVVRHLAATAGVDQFLDVGTGIPTAGNTHQVAHQVNPAAKVVYVDNDPTVLVHARALLNGSLKGRVDYIDADVRDPEPILQAATETLDFSRPVALMLLCVLDFVPDDTLVHDAVGVLVDALAPGSYVAIASSVTSPAMDKAADAWNASGAAPILLRTPRQLVSMFTGLDLLQPGVVSLPQWWPDAATEYTDREVYQYGGLGRKA
ncbi:hypothetical protein Aph01nite_70120 [Acrocarpospora phusangensis]|uniref:S-adenosyl methyltransferase n=1 Tax=Acrocarpospora phusangensis TaxID=1070424 RepID=A0A919QGU8_9ACTN|nr:SAM-dependent methyltransferase [Acrocarpospora phusangensis]GIH28702.1 hypothetical protein Aph01nite_70120 [Acrocarpospora phusangensis]